MPKWCMEHHEALIRFEETLRENTKAVKDIRYRLFGNGQEGIIRTIARHDTYFKIIGATLIILVGGILANIGGYL